ncbi:Receptor-like protein kinase [Thalictrum thalictroides]|uniref:non-specific serine/threonine protein kinase n=1 Tax=Thalictrum thalictroides TaxID=46969 RepID=A0A7J6V472_THATH|nr:Receptor-like protein kinase [Thalictrum thalictroides]
MLLDLSGNKLSNRIPAGIFSELDLLISLNLSENSLSGELPRDIATLEHLSSLDFSRNNISGSIPESFSDLTNLKFLNLSFNQLEGPVPTAGIFRNLSLISLGGNPGLCGRNLLRPCNREAQSNTNRRFSKKAVLILIVLGSIFATLFLVCVVLVYHRCFRKEKTETAENSEPQYYLAPSLKRFNQKDLESITNFFDEGNVIGQSASSTVYKGRFENAEVAVKRLSLLQFSSASDKGFDRELSTLNQIKHRNLVKIIGYAWESGKIKALVLEYMVNGSLESVIHDPGTNMSRWTFSERLKVCVSVANGLVYLHSGYGEPIVHCDLKPSNILLDGDWEAHVSDFGTARMLGFNLQDQSGSSSSSAYQGTIGYLAPEFAYGSKITTKADIFSFGIVVMEFLTRRRPTGTIEDNGCPITLHQFVEDALTNGFQRLLQVIDPDLASSISTQNDEKRMVDLLELALSCTQAAPENRPDMDEVLSVLLTISESKD